jgi:hypothetical protein
MKPGMALLCVANAASMLLLVGCGGTSQTGLNGSDSGGGSDGAPTSGGADGSTPLNPGTIGGIIGSMGPDGGAGSTYADAGSTAMPSTPQVVGGCNQLCEKQVAAGCSAGGTLNSCIVGCQVILNNPNCASAAQTLFSCLANATASCDASGNVVFDRCQIEQLTADTCFLQNANDPTLADPCATYCASVTAAKCPNDTPGCQGGCQILGNLVAGCDAAWKSYVTCANGSTLTCGADGKAGAQACASQALRFYSCVTGGLATILSDAGR